MVLASNLARFIRFRCKKKYSDHPIKFNPTYRAFLVEKIVFGCYKNYFLDQKTFFINEFKKEEKKLKEYLYEIPVIVKNSIKEFFPDNSKDNIEVSKIGLSNEKFSVYCDIFLRLGSNINVIEIKDRVWNFNYPNIGDAIQLSIFSYLMNIFSSIAPKLYVYYVPSDLVLEIDPISIDIINLFLNAWKYGKKIFFCGKCPFCNICGGESI